MEAPETNREQEPGGLMLRFDTRKARRIGKRCSWSAGLCSMDAPSDLAHDYAAENGEIGSLAGVLRWCSMARLYPAGSLHRDHDDGGRMVGTRAARHQVGHQRRGTYGRVGEHLDRFGAGNDAVLSASGIFLALLRDLQLVNSHFASPGYAVLPLTGRQTEPSLAAGEVHMIARL